MLPNEIFHNIKKGRYLSNKIKEIDMARITVEDALKKVNNRFVIAHMAMRRVKMYHQGYKPLIECNNTEIVTALREIAAGKVKLKKPIKEAGIEV